MFQKLFSKLFGRTIIVKKAMREADARKFIAGMDALTHDAQGLNLEQATARMDDIADSVKDYDRESVRLLPDATQRDLAKAIDKMSAAVGMIHFKEVVVPKIMPKIMKMMDDVPTQPTIN